MSDWVRLLLAVATLLGAGSSVARELHDPTRPPGRVPTQLSVTQALPQLTSILLGSERRVAVIDGRVLREGMTDSGLTLVEVAANSVVVSVNGGPHRTLQLTSIHKERQ